MDSLTKGSVEAETRQQAMKSLWLDFFVLFVFSRLNILSLIVAPCYDQVSWTYFSPVIVGTIFLSIASYKNTSSLFDPTILFLCVFGFVPDLLLFMNTSQGTCVTVDSLFTTWFRFYLFGKSSKSTPLKNILGGLISTGI
jgi:hypothetical protein